MPSLLNFIKDASPSNRNFDCAYVTIDNHEGKPVGTYVQGFYQLAQVGGLKCQVERNQYTNAAEMQKYDPKLYKKLYRSDGTPKTALELAIIHKIAKEDIQTAIMQEYTWQNAHGQVPQDVSKYRVVPEWLSNFTLEASRLRMRGAPQRTTVTIDNQPKPKDGLLHSTLQVIGLLMTLTAFVGLVMGVLPAGFLASLSTAAVVGVAAVTALAGYFVLNTMGLGNVCNFFGLGEVLWTDVRALTSKQFLKANKPISWGKLFNSIGYGLAIGGLSFMAASATFAGIMALPFVAGLGIAGSMTAGLFASVAFVGSFIGGVSPVRCFFGFGIWDNTISQKDIFYASANIKPLKEEKAPSKLVDNYAKRVKEGRSVLNFAWPSYKERTTAILKDVPDHYKSPVRLVW